MTKATDSDEDVIVRHLYAERFINDGSPTGLTFRRASTIPTAPRTAPGGYPLPIVRVSPDDIVGWGAWETRFTYEDGLGLPVHPDVVPMLGRMHRRRVVTSTRPFPWVVPTASPRTVVAWAFGTAPCYVKLHYPAPLGRFGNDLTDEKLSVPVQLSQYLGERSEEGVPSVLPEPAAIEAAVGVDGSVMGALVRDMPELAADESDVIPAFALFGTDWLSPDEPPLVERWLSSEPNPTHALVASVLEPILDSFWALSIRFGLIPEPHAQNILISLSEGLRPRRVIWRDIQGFSRDWRRVPARLRALGAYRLIPDGPGAPARRSYLIDWMLGTYVFDPLLRAADRVGAFDMEEAERRIVSINDQALALAGEGYLPAGRSFEMGLEAPGRDRLSLRSSTTLRWRSI